MHPGPIHLLLGWEHRRQKGCLEGLGVPGARIPTERSGGKRPHLGSWVVLETEKQLVSKAAGLVCTGGIVHASVCLVNTAKVLVGWVMVLVGCPPSSAAPDLHPQAC